MQYLIVSVTVYGTMKRWISVKGPLEVRTTSVDIGVQIKSKGNASVWLANKWVDSEYQKDGNSIVVTTKLGGEQTWVLDGNSESILSSDGVKLEKVQ